MSTEYIAKRTLIGKSSKQGRFLIKIRIGKPYRNDFDWACPVEVEGLDTNIPDVNGADSLQALTLAVWTARNCLERFMQQGGTLDAPGERPGPVSLEEIFGY